MHKQNSLLRGWVCLLPCLAIAVPVHASDCSQTSMGLTPLTDLGSNLYLGLFEGGLYPGGVNTPPPSHGMEGLARAQNMEPLDSMGNSHEDGKIVLLSIGMSNTTQEFCSQNSLEPCNAWTLMGKAAAHAEVNHNTLVIVNGARGGQAATSWDSPSDGNYDRVLNDQLTPKGLTEAQVQIVWVKQANPGPSISLPNANAVAYALMGSLGDIARAVRVRYPNVKILFLSNRIYAGYASTQLNPEPFAYETGFSIKWLIKAQIDHEAGGSPNPIAGDLDYDTVAPWLAWGPDLWADGLTPRSDGLTWECGDLEQDGIHPAMSAEQKVGTLLMNFFLDSPFGAPWFRSQGLAAIPTTSAYGIAAMMLGLLIAAAIIMTKRNQSQA